MAAVLILGIWGCSGGGTTPSVEFPQLREVAFSRVRSADADRSAPPDPGERVFRDAASWDAFRQQHPGMTLPDVDFATQHVAAVFLGQRNTGGYSVKIERITYDPQNQQTRIHAVERQPGMGCMVTQALTAPYDIVVFAANPGTAQWERTTEAVACR